MYKIRALGGKIRISDIVSSLLPNISSIPRILPKFTKYSSAKPFRSSNSHLSLVDTNNQQEYVTVGSLAKKVKLKPIISKAKKKEVLKVFKSNYKTTLYIEKQKVKERNRKRRVARNRKIGKFFRNHYGKVAIGTCIVTLFVLLSLLTHYIRTAIAQNVVSKDVIYHKLNEEFTPDRAKIEQLRLKVDELDAGATITYYKFRKKRRRQLLGRRGKKKRFIIR
jgi:hypothetical protein